MVATLAAHKYTSIVDEINMTMKSIKTTNLVDNAKNTDTIKAYEISWRDVMWKTKALLRDNWTRDEYIEWRDNWKNSYMELSYQIFAFKNYIRPSSSEKPKGYVEANYQSIKDRLANVAEMMMAIKTESKIKSEESYQLHHNKVTA